MAADPRSYLARPHLDAAANPLSRGRCPWCGRDVALRRTGALWEHRASGAWSWRLCMGSGKGIEVHHG